MGRATQYDSIQLPARRRQRQCLEVLLKLDALVRCQHDIERIGGLAQESTVLEAPPTDLGNGLGFVAYKQLCQRSWERLIE
jgi:hypothetical protein